MSQAELTRLADPTITRELRSITGVAEVSVAGKIGSGFQEPDRFIDNTFDFSDNVIFNRGRHSITVGGNLKRYRGTVLLVSHDRDLLNRAVDSILHLEHSKLTLYSGGYDTFLETRAQKQALDAAMRTHQEAERKRIQAFVDRFRYKASKARQAQSRMKWLEKMKPITLTVAT